MESEYKSLITSMGSLQKLRQSVLRMIIIEELSSKRKVQSKKPES